MDKSRTWSDRWERQQQLGQGAQGLTFVARSKTNSEDLCVIKEPRRQDSLQSRLRMEREVLGLNMVADAGGRVPHVLSSNATTDTAKDKSVRLYLAMEYIQGETLKRLVDRGRLGLPTAKQLILDISQTVKIAHALDVLHRDLKPDNIVVRRDGETILPYIVDFGIAFIGEDDADGLTRIDERVGNRFIELPEAWGACQRDKRTDLIGIAGLLFYCLTAQPPRSIDDANRQMPHQRIANPFESMSELERHHLNTFFSKAFARDFERRFQTIDELTERIADLGTSRFAFPQETPLEAAARVSALLNKHHRETILARLAEKASPLQDVINTLISDLSMNLKDNGYSLHTLGTTVREMDVGVDLVLSTDAVLIQLLRTAHRRLMCFSVGVVDNECIVYCDLAAPRQNGWEFRSRIELLKYAGDAELPKTLLRCQIESQLTDLIIELGSLILPDHVK